MAGPYATSRGRSSSPSPFGHRTTSRQLPPSSSSSSSNSSFPNGRPLPRSSPASVSSSLYPSTNGSAPRSMTPGRGRARLPAPPEPVAFASVEDLLAEDVSRSGDSISVTIRFRPLSEREFQRGDEIAWYADGDKIVRQEYNPATAYAFDKVFGPATNSKQVYDVAASPVVKAAMDGINGTVFAYGVTSSGKTHTMHGDQNSPGIIPLAIKDVFSIIQDTPGREFLLRVSYLEIYNEVINDLLDPVGQNLRVREDAQGTYVEGIKEEVVLSPGHALSFIAAGEAHRHVGSNNFNLLSSRSHTIFTLMIESSAHGDEYDGVTFSQLNLIDLAGSESSKTETTGLRRKEGSYINKSLLTLGTVIGKLSEGKASHIPYRDSKLTRLLQSSLSGHGHVSLICTVTPASSNMEETHNTLKFASRAKRVEIYASRNRIIDEKSLIKKYQKEISTLKEELDQLKKGVLAGVSQEEILTLRQKLEEGQVKMQSRLEEEEEAKAALMSRIQRLTKLILVSTKNSIPGCLTDIPAHQRAQSSGDEDKLEIFRQPSANLIESEGIQTHENPSMKLGDFLGGLNGEQSAATSAITGSIHDGENLSLSGVSMSDQMDLLTEQVKMLAGEVAFGTSTLKRLAEQSTNDPTPEVQTQIQSLEREIQDKQMQMRNLEQQIIKSSEASMQNSSLADMQQTIMRLMTLCNEKGFELELRTADNRILQEQLQEKCSENKALQEKVLDLRQQLASTVSENEMVTSKSYISEEIDELKRKLKSQDLNNEKFNRERIQLMEENSGLQIQNQKLAEEASYAKELASAAATELKNLAEEVTKLSLQNAKQAKELLAAQNMAYSGYNANPSNGSLRKHLESKNDGSKLGRRSRPGSRGGGIGTMHDDSNSWNLELEDMKMELLARKKREAVLEAALSEKDRTEEEYKKKYDEAKKREATLENDLAGMWVLVAKLKKGVLGVSEMTVDEKSAIGINSISYFKENSYESKDTVLKEKQLSDQLSKPNQDQCNQNVELEPLLLRLKAQIQQMKERKHDQFENEVANSHTCKVCFEAQSAAVLLPCRHFCLCKACSLACSECPVCRTEVADRIITLAS